jgi:hypothetical protein
MNFVGKLVTTVAGLLVAYYITTLFLTSIITGTTTGDTLVKTIGPIAAAAGTTIGLLLAFFKQEG